MEVAWGDETIIARLRAFKHLVFCREIQRPGLLTTFKKTAKI